MEYMSQTEIEAYYEKKKRQNKRFIIASLVLIFGGGLFCLISLPIGMVFFLIGWVIAIAFLLSKPFHKLSEIEKPIREAIVGDMMNLDSYQENQKFPEEMIQETQMYDEWDSYSGGHLTEGRYRTVPVRFCEVRLSHSDYDRDGDSYNVPDFSGFFLEATCHHMIQGELRIKKDAVRSFDDLNQEVKENPYRLFKVEEDTWAEASLLLTDDFMDAVLANEIFYKREMKCLLRGSQVLVAIDNPLFSGGGKTLDDFKESIQKDIEFIKYVLDSLIDKTELFR
ncbi:MAG: DUF3137 domain-containing protein [Lachnospiraceae bacterium]|nr:DUF3137 domain-containing protein [Lachnospiraceae bacterium]